MVRVLIEAIILLEGFSGCCAGEMKPIDLILQNVAL